MDWALRGLANTIICSCGGLAARVGFVPAIPSTINDLGLIRSPQTAKSTQNLSIRYKTGTAILRRLSAPLGAAPGEECTSGVVAICCVGHR
jgi:hypothetical protein